jgi:uncharacterized protein (TIGR03086 family)
MTLDLTPAARLMAQLITGIADDQLNAPTPCPAYSVGDLADHVDGLSLAFTAAAKKERGGATGQAPSGDVSRLTPRWRSQTLRHLTALAEAWRDPAAWTGTTEAGGVELPGEVAGLVALDELVLHGWDVARATGQAFTCDDESLGAVYGFVSQFSGPGMEAQREGLFGPVVDIGDDAPLVDRIVALAGRDPAWTGDRIR